MRVLPAIWKNRTSRQYDMSVVRKNFAARYLAKPFSDISEEHHEYFGGRAACLLCKGVLVAFCDTVIPIEQLRKIAEHLGINTGKIVDGAEEIGRGFESKGIPVDWDTRQIKNQDAALLGGLVIGAIITYLLVKK